MDCCSASGVGEARGFLGCDSMSLVAWRLLVSANFGDWKGHVLYIRSGCKMVCKINGYCLLDELIIVIIGMGVMFAYFPNLSCRPANDDPVKPWLSTGSTAYVASPVASAAELFRFLSFR